MENHLAGESSPYLLQHKDNPVDWYPWGPEAMRRARDEDKPIFLSIGYSACHWCHVMEHESFTNDETASFLNANFISIKVDREERPDLDDVYMQAVTSLTGSGGWPLSTWLTPEGVPFYGGTYFPPSPRYDRPSFMQVLTALADMWKTRRGDLLDAAAKIHEHLARECPHPSAPAQRADILAEAAADLARTVDGVHGGWGAAPKFPAPLALEFLLACQTVRPQREAERAIRLTLDAMAAGGAYDQLGGGFHRYSVDDDWLVPHFEKMLYDNAQLARCYLHAWQVFGEPRYREVAEETLDYLLRRMQHLDGGFFSAEDADSEGQEGAFYTWTPAQLASVLSAEQADLVVRTFGVTERGNFERTNVLHRGIVEPDDRPALLEAKSRLLEARERRTRPARDEKVLAGWNGLALAAFAEAACTLDCERYAEAAVKTADFIVSTLVHDDSRLAHSCKDGRPSGNGFLEDYACVVEGLLAVYATTFSERWFGAARKLGDAMIQHFHRPAGGFFDTSDDHESLIIRPRSLRDSPTPSGNSMAATVLLKLGAYTGEHRYAAAAESALVPALALVSRAPVMFGQWLSAQLRAETATTEVAIVGDVTTAPGSELLSVARSAFRPHAVVAARPAGRPSLIPMLENREPAPGTAATAWVCRRSTCAPPTSDPAELEHRLATTA
jgi:uncharacterized protein YyaL (SSP411 family)